MGILDEINNRNAKPPKRNKDLFYAVINGLCALVCLLDIVRLWSIFLLFALLCAYFIWHHTKHSKDPATFSENLKGYAKDKIIGRQAAETHKERKKKYQEAINSIENEYNDEELDNLISEETDTQPEEETEEKDYDAPEYDGSDID